MATPVANLPSFVPVTPADTTASAVGTPTRPSGDTSPFQTALAAAQFQESPPAAETNAAAEVATTEVARAEVDNAIELELDTEVEVDPALVADSSLSGLLAFVTQVLSPPENAAVAQATGQAGESLTPGLTVTAGAEAQADVPAESRSRADQLRLDRGNVARPNANAATAPTPTDVPAAATAARANPNAAPLTPIDTEVPTTADAVATPAAAAVRTAAAPRGGSSIPAQAPIVTNLLTPVPTPANLSVESPPVAEPTAAVAASGLPSAQLGERPATAGEQFVADAATGARLATPAAGSVVFANTLSREVSGPVPPVPTPEASVATVLAAPPPTATARVGAADSAAAFGVTAADDAAPAPTATFGRAVADIARFVAQPAESPLATGMPVTRVAVEEPCPVVEATPADETRSAEAPVATAVPGAPIPLPAPAARAAAAETSAVRATPAAQISDTIVAHARVLERDGGVEFQMRLDPPELGRLQIRLVSRGDEMHGQVLVASDAVRGLIESQLPELRQRLEAAGVSVQSFDVSTDPGGGGRNPYRDAATEFLPRFAAATPAPPTARVGRAGGGSLDVTV